MEIAGGLGAIVSELLARPENPEQVQGGYGPGGKPQECAQERVELKSQAQPEVEHDDRQQKQDGVGGDPDFRGGHCATILPTPGRAMEVFSNYLKMARRHCRRNHRSAHASCNTPR